MHEIDANIINVACQWRATLADDHVSTVDKNAFVKWLEENPLHKEAYEQVEKFWQDLEFLKQESLDDSFFIPTWRERTRSVVWRIHECINKKSKPAFYGLGGVCALVLLVFLCFPQIILFPSYSGEIFATGIGEKKTLHLADGSRITLGADTSVKVTFTRTSRHIQMSTGEAFYEVAKDPKRPFIVVSGEHQITVHGTIFDVRHNTQRIQVAVREGVVSVTALQKISPLDRTKPPQPPTSHSPLVQSKILKAGEQLTILAEKGLQPVTHIQPQSIGLWRNNILAYIDTPLSEIVADMNRYQSRKISIHDALVANIKITATFNSNDVDKTLQTLTEILPIRLESSTESLRIYSAFN
ncbi:FecR family protein [Pseudodesulfovibrio piezophilus]|uniref:Putative Anti-FecI sigma factor, FecR n=1 Tax=Pseudodesulfovibrio piezophilus (strain DSM 21447 / JCM 15486 / C1TLV30) TaxID=1322246 RepID=M1WNV5_PSEP2|nr:FecR domain-containing protein [Pseudodesulfovibrio piezophilus]CCH47809.1 putative Anti-FecI sigma factor, FecR [Pseudodesulfovibrio piezophilus C1TLV30]